MRAKSRLVASHVPRNTLKRGQCVLYCAGEIGFEPPRQISKRLMNLLRGGRSTRRVELRSSLLQRALERFLAPGFNLSSRQRLAKRASLERRVYPHGLRHTPAADLALQGVPVLAIQQQLTPR